MFRVLSTENHFKKMFPELDTLEIKRLEGAGKSFIAHKGDVVAEQGKNNEGLLLLVNGRASIRLQEKKAKNIVHFLTPGEVFYAQEAFLNKDNKTSCVCMETSLFFIIPGEKLLEMTQSIPSLMLNLINLSAKETVLFENRAANLVTLPVRHRFIESLKTLLHKFGEQHADHFFIPIRREEVGAYINASKASLSRIVNELEENKVIKSTRKGITIYDRELLLKQS